MTRNFTSQQAGNRTFAAGERSRLQLWMANANLHTFPFMRQHCRDTQQKFITTAVSMGAYHAANFFFRNPHIFDVVISLSGLYRLNHLIGEYMDDIVSFNAPLAYLSRMNDPWYLDQFRQSQIIVAAGQGAWEEEMLADTLELKKILDQKDFPYWVEVWG